MWQSARVNGAKRLGRRHLIAIARHPTRRDGGAAIALLVLPWTVALVLARRHHHLDGGTVALLVSLSLGLPSLWLIWTTYRGPKRSGAPLSDLSLAQVADELAIAVGVQWDAEAAIRRLNDPYPLPMSWSAADPLLTDPWNSLVKLATSGIGRSSPTPAETWAAGPDELAGEGGELAEVLARVPTGRLVVLGEPGAGKTMLMVRLVLDLLARRASGGPVPILASVASWNPAEQDLRGWLAAKLMIDHPNLVAAPPASMQQLNQAVALLASGLILPVLDGLDEIPEEVRGPAISRVNDALRPGEQVVVTCRTREFRDAVRPEGGIEVTLRAATAVQLRPLDADAVRSYLCDDAAGPLMKARWTPVLAVLGTEAPAGQALSTPLMVALARVIYNRRPGELAGTLRDPAELCDPTCTNRAAVEYLLFDAFIPAAYPHDPAWHRKAQAAESWLVFLARHLERTIASPDLAWWQLRLAVPRLELAIVLAARMVAMILAGAGFGAAFGAGIVGGARFGASAGAAAAAAAAVVVLAVLPKPPNMVREIRLELPNNDDVISQADLIEVGLLLRVLAGTWILIGVLVGTAAMVGAVAETVAGSRIVATIVAGAGLGVMALASALSIRQASDQTIAPLSLFVAASPQAVAASDRATGRIVGAVAGVVAAVLAGDLFWAMAVAGTGGVILAGVMAGAIAGVISSLVLTSWAFYGIARTWLALRHRLPWSVMDFLDDAHRRGVLRRAGQVYQFRHIELQHRLANRGIQASSKELSCTSRGGPLVPLRAVGRRAGGVLPPGGDGPAVVRRDGTVLVGAWLPELVQLGELERHLGDGVTGLARSAGETLSNSAAEIATLEEQLQRVRSGGTVAGDLTRKFRCGLGSGLLIGGAASLPAAATAGAAAAVTWFRSCNSVLTAVVRGF